jgi:cobalt-zinc-cadmium efflux system membrane fusion protein
MKTTIAIAGTLAMLGGLVGCSGTGSVTEAKSPAPVEAPAAAPVVADRVEIPADSPQLSRIKVEAVKSMVVPVGMVSAPSKIEANANHLSHVVLPVAGRIVSINAKIGESVEQGQPLITIESPDADAATSAYLQAQAAGGAAKSAATKAQSDLDRSKDLYSHGAVPEKDVLNAQAVLTQAQATIRQTDAVTEQARRKLTMLGLSPDNFGQIVTVVAPISGKVLEVTAVKGEFRNDLSASLVTIADLSTVWVSSDVPETSIRLVKVGEAMKIQLDAYPGQSLVGKVLQIGDMVDPQSRTIKVRAELPNPTGKLKPEMFGTVQFAEQTEQKPTVPEGAVEVASGRTFVWRTPSAGVFEKVSVVTGAQVGDRLAVLSGLAAGDSVVVDGVMLLQAK